MIEGEPMAEFKKQFKKGLLELVILKLLTEEDHYGYSLIQEVNKKSNDSLNLKEGTLYPIMYRLEDQKLIENYWSTPSEGRGKPRKYYRITSLGKEKCNEMLKDYFEIIDNISSILKG